MPVSVIVGGQFGSEGKGKVAHFWAKETSSKVAIRIGGTNSGHTVVDSSGNSLVLRQLPTPSIIEGVTCVLGAGSYINPKILFSEMELVGLSPDRLLIDPNAFVISDEEEQEERNGSLRQSIGSTQSGTGAAVQRRISRSADTKLASRNDQLKPFVKPVVPYLRACLEDDERIIIEGTQGFGLSLLHSDYYPFVTSRDTSAAAFVSETGLSPLDVDQVIMVLRTFPIRVSGNSGPLPEETTWEAITKNSNSSTPIIEYTSVTKAIRRVAEFHSDVVNKSIMVNRPTHIVLNHIDYLDKCESSITSVSGKAEEFIKEVESSINASIDYVGFGPASMVPRNNSLAKYKVS